MEIIHFNNEASSVSIEWLALVRRIQEVCGSNLGAETAYSEFLRGFPPSLQVNSGIVP